MHKALTGENKSVVTRGVVDGARGGTSATFLEWKRRCLTILARNDGTMLMILRKFFLKTVFT